MIGVGERVVEADGRWKDGGDMEQIVDEASVLCEAKIKREKKKEAKCRYQS